MSSATEPLSPNSAPIASVPEVRKLELLRHYQYHVAPWVGTEYDSAMSDISFSNISCLISLISVI